MSQLNYKLQSDEVMSVEYCHILRFFFLACLFVTSSFAASSERSAHDYYREASFLYIQSKLEPALLECEDGLKYFPNNEKLQSLEDRIRELLDSRKPPPKDKKKQSSSSGDSSSDSQGSSSNSEKNSSNSDESSSNSQGNSSDSQDSPPKDDEVSDDQKEQPHSDEMSEAEVDALLKDFEKEELPPKGKRKKGRIIRKDW